MSQALDPASGSERPLAAALFLAWRAASAPLQAALEATIRRQVERTPAFRSHLQAVVAYYATVSWLPASSPRWLATMLYAAWDAADAPVRADLESAIRAHVAGHPAFRLDLTEVLLLNERIAATGRS